MWNARSAPKSGSLSSCLPLKVEQLLSLLADEYEALQGDVTNLREELDRSRKVSSHLPPQSNHASSVPSVSSSFSLSEAPRPSQSNRRRSLFGSGAETIKSFTMNPKKRRQSRVSNYCHHNEIGSPRAESISRRSSIVSSIASSCSMLGHSAINVQANPSIGNSVSLRVVPEMPAFAGCGPESKSALITNNLMSQLPGKLSVIHSERCSPSGSVRITDDEISDIVKEPLRLPNLQPETKGRRSGRAMTAPEGDEEVKKAQSALVNSWKPTTDTVVIEPPPDDLIPMMYESQYSKHSHIGSAIGSGSGTGSGSTETQGFTGIIPAAAKESFKIRSNTVTSLALPSITTPGGQTLNAKFRSFSEAVDAPESSVKEVPSDTKNFPHLMAKVPGYFGLLRSLSSTMLTHHTNDSSRSFSMAHTRRNPSARFLLSPIGQIRLGWDLLICISFLGDMWMSMFTVFYLAEVAMPNGIIAFAVAITTCFFADIILNFQTGRTDGCMSGRAIAKRYLRTWFWFDIIASIPWNAFLPRVMGMIRLIRILKMPTMPSFSYLWHVLRRKGNARLPFVLAIAFLIWVLFAHTHACLWQLARDEDKATDFNDALSQYYESFWWAFTAFAYGSHTATQSWTRTLEICIAAERFVFLTLAGGWSIFQLAVFYKDPVHVASLMDDALSYMRQHRVGPLTQLNVARTIRDVTEGRSARENFYELVSSLPGDLRQTISREMWKEPLISLELLAVAVEWHPAFMSKLLVLVGEEALPLGAVLCSEGETQKIACKIMSGRLAVTNKQHHLPDLLEGMWFGENALVNPYLPSSGTATAKTSAMLMSIPVPEFHQLLADLELSNTFKQECAERLWRGLCGRCGAFGDHFAHECHTIQGSKRPTKKLSHLGRQFTSTFSKGNKLNPAPQPLRRDLQEFLGFRELKQLGPTLSRLQIRNLQDFERAMRSNAKAREEILAELPADQRESLTPNAILEFCKRAAEEIREKIEMSTPKKCLIFLSHYKVEAGTEAALMRAELELLIDKDPRQLGRYFETPVFLDSENLTDLDALQQHVVESHNLVLMLTKGVLTRPWVLVEILTAARNGVPIIPLQIVKPEAEFEFPTDEWYAELRDGKFLDQDAMLVLTECKIDLVDLEKAIRSIFKRIAIRYSPHRAASIRKAELEAVLREVALRKAPVL